MSALSPRPNPPHDPSAATAARRRAPLGYCTNVHAGATLTETRANLERYATAVRELFSPGEAMGVGIWLSAASAAALLADPNQLQDFAHWLGEAGLVPYTFNGFPHGDFHQEVVKHHVYEPTWAEPARRQYTLDLIQVIDQLLPPGEEGSISTMPLAWGTPEPSADFLQAAASELRTVAQHLAQLEDASGRLIYVCLEPEPGCILQRSGDVVRFFDEYLRRGPLGDRVTRYLRVCHDICHQAVMFELPHEVLARYREAGIAIGKVQASAAVRLPLAELSPAERQQAVVQLATFSEGRYLHQSVLRSPDGERFFEDLELALAAIGQGDAVDEVRVHFHVPVYLQRFGFLHTTQDAIRETLAALRPEDCHHFEVETYAWEVVPEPLRRPSLAEGIAQELRWFADVAAQSAR